MREGAINIAGKHDRVMSAFNGCNPDFQRLEGRGSVVGVQEGSTPGLWDEDIEGSKVEKGVA